MGGVPDHSSGAAPTYVVSDVHGHPDDLLRGLRGAGLVDAAGDWCGGPAQLWVLGDLLDRGPDGLGVVRLLRQLQEQAPGSVHVLLGNHEVLALGTWLHPGGPFEPVWRRNGGVPADQAGLTPDDIAWLRLLPAVALVGDQLLVHSDTELYLEWGRSVAEVNATVASLLAGGEAELAELWRVLTNRMRFTGTRGPDRARELLGALGGRRVVHGHTVIPLLTGSRRVTGPHEYADGLALAVDGGRYDGGPLLVVPLGQPTGWSAARFDSPIARPTHIARPR